jgi:hypothetical protein
MKYFNQGSQCSGRDPNQESPTSLLDQLAHEMNGNDMTKSQMTGQGPGNSPLPIYSVDTNDPP